MKLFFLKGVFLAVLCRRSWSFSSLISLLRKQRRYRVDLNPPPQTSACEAFGAQSSLLAWRIFLCILSVYKPGDQQRSSWTAVSRAQVVLSRWKTRSANCSNTLKKIHKRIDGNCGTNGGKCQRGENEKNESAQLLWVSRPLVWFEALVMRDLQFSVGAAFLVRFKENCCRLFIWWPHIHTREAHDRRGKNQPSHVSRVCRPDNPF